MSQVIEFNKLIILKIILIIKKSNI